jgi:membrane protease YdiL (CAAX protease family)
MDTAQNDSSRLSRLHAWFVVVLTAAIFLGLVKVCSHVMSGLLGDYASQGLRQHVTVLLTSSAVGELLFLLLLTLYLHWRGQSVAGLGFGRRAPWRGWIAAAVLTGFMIAFFLAGPLRGRAALGEISFFHLYNSILVGVVAGFCEEITFRGFVMTKLAQAHFGRWAQALGSALLFGLAHAGWGGVTGAFDAQVFVGSVLSTTVLGMLYAAVYLVSRRNLLPAITSHVLIDGVIEPWLALAALSGVIGH